MSLQNQQHASNTVTDTKSDAKKESRATSKRNKNEKDREEKNLFRDTAVSLWLTEACNIWGSPHERYLILDKTQS